MLSAASLLLLLSTTEIPPTRSAVLHPQGVVLAGEGLHLLQAGKLRKVSSESYGEGLCLLGSQVVVQQGLQRGPLLKIELASGHREVIDADTEMKDCRATPLLGRPGLLMLERGMQLRHYRYEARKWPYREVYSFYTASWQGGLQQGDVNGDGRPDLFAGNYWMESPRSYELPWQLFAINVWNEKPQSARAALLWRKGTLLWSEGSASPARLARFRPPANPRAMWDHAPVQSPSPLHFPRALCTCGGYEFVAEYNGAASRVLMIEGLQATVVAESDGIHTLLCDKGMLIGVGEKKLWRWRIRAQRR
jgi:hypothetical protein